MNEVERRIALVEDAPREAPNPGELIALLDPLRSETLNVSQAAAVLTIREGLLALVYQQISMGDVKGSAFPGRLT